MNRAYCLIIILLVCKIGEGQNLVSNGDFEQYSSCPTNYSQLNLAVPWINPSTGGGSPDYYNQCSTSSTVGVPNNVSGFQYAHSGVGYSGIYLRQNCCEIREYLEIPLAMPLISQICYHFEMYINNANYSQYTSDAIGVYFSDTLVTGIGNFNPLPFAPQVNNPSGILFDTLNWTLVSGNYTATGGENYLIIGNFKFDSLTNYIQINSTSPFTTAYVYIDDVSLSPCTYIDEQNIHAEIQFYPNPFSDKLNVVISNNEFSEIIFYDTVSRKILHQTFTNSALINTEHLAKGLYLYDVRNKKGVIKKGKILKN
jgi:hypothetical protein